MNPIILKSFTCEDSGGNGAGLVILDDYISEEHMQAMALDIGLSETAFVKKIDDENYDVRFFTPVCEVDLCGHATIAAFYYVGNNLISHKSGEKRVYQNTKAGRLSIDIFYADGVVHNVYMEQAKPQFFEKICGEQKINLAKSLGIDVSFIGLENITIKPEIVSTGLKDILIPVKNNKILNAIKPDFDMISDLSAINDACGYHVYTIENNQVYARNFAPLVGINEECATGTSNGALGALLHREGIKSGYFDVLQGEAMQQLSKICVYVDDKVVKVGGSAKIFEKE